MEEVSVAERPEFKDALQRHLDKVLEGNKDYRNRKKENRRGSNWNFVEIYPDEGYTHDEIVEIVFVRDYHQIEMFTSMFCKAAENLKIKRMDGCFDNLCEILEAHGLEGDRQNFIDQFIARNKRIYPNYDSYAEGFWLR